MSNELLTGIRSYAERLDARVPSAEELMPSSVRTPDLSEAETHQPRRPMVDRLWQPPRIRWTAVAGLIGLALLFLFVALLRQGGNDSPFVTDPSTTTEPRTEESIPIDGTMTVASDVVLADDHAGHIVITSDNVTLDCAGHTITGSGSGFGIHLLGRSGVTIRDCQVTNFTTGIQLDESSGNSLLDNIVLSNSQNGISLNGSNDNTVDGNEAIENGLGRESTWGIVLFGSHNNRVVNNVSRDHFEAFYLEGSNGNTVSSNSAVGGDTGFVFGNSDGNTVLENSARDMTTGFHTDPRADDNAFTGNTATGSLGDGFTIGGGGNQLTGNQSLGSSGFGFVDGSIPLTNTYTGNVCTGNVRGPSSPPGLCDPGDQ